MDYTATLDFLYSLNQPNRKRIPLLENMKFVLATLGNPHESYNIIHVAGTNGKGSVTLKCAKALEDSGFRVGLYISPHIVTFRERI